MDELGSPMSSSAGVGGEMGLKIRIKVGVPSSSSQPSPLESVSTACLAPTDSPMTGMDRMEKKRKKKEKKNKKDKKHRHKRRKGNELAVVVEEGTVEESRECGLLQKLLLRLLKVLQTSDVNHFFAQPVSDAFAPGYSQIITQPMDFSTMRTKLSSNHYVTLAHFKDDFELVCTNAMTYNLPQTIYYKEAKKLLALGKRLMSPKRLRSLNQKWPFLLKLTKEELGFDINEVSGPSKGGEGSDNDEDDDDDEEDEDDDDKDQQLDLAQVIEDIRDVVKRPPGRFEAIPDDLTSTEILEQAQTAAKAAADNLRLYRAKGSRQMGFLRQKDDGSTSLSFITPGQGLVPGTERDRPVTLGTMVPKVKQGTGHLQTYREDRRNVAKGVTPLYYGAFSSHAPSYDSTFANLTKEETEMVYSTYGDEVGVQYAESIINFARDCDYASFIVDHLLDILTSNEHRKTIKHVEEQKTVRKEDALISRTIEESDKVDFDALATLSEEGIDMSFLENLKNEFEQQDCNNAAPQPSTPLEANARLLTELHKEQHERLSQPVPHHFASIAKPSEKELELANRIQGNLISMASKVAPGDVVPNEPIRKMLGIPNEVAHE